MSTSGTRKATHESGGDLTLALFQRCDAKKDIEKVITRKELLSA